MGALAAFGYFVVAGFFWGHVILSAFIVLAAAMLYGLLALWVQVQTSARGGERSGLGDPDLPRVDVASIGEQTRSLLDVFVTVALLGTLWWVWSDALPMLSTVGDYPLWSSTDLVDGKAVLHRITLNSLLLALLTAAVAAIAVRNVSALLDVALLRRLDMQADANYAIKVTARYAIAAAGILLVARFLGIGWSDVQWLVAALGVGLGFGLQEIVANFVSGLIILAERPIRIGDTITVGGVSGRVTSIRARATIIVDPDNKEVLIPNKAFITERVINWTYSDETTRIVIKFSLPRGADVVAAERGVIEAIGRIPDVLREPGPTVYVTGFRDTHLDLEIRAFVDKLGKQMRVQHEISLAVDRVLHDMGVATVPAQNKVAAADAQPSLRATGSRERTDLD
jgi:potassium efflux system protein